MPHMYPLKSSRLKIIFLYILLIFNFLSPFLAYAKHIIGGEMTYRFIQQVGSNTNRYEFTLIIYRDCDSGGGQLDNPANIGIYRGDFNNATLYSDFNVNLQSNTTVDPIIPPCADASAVSNACVQRGVYVFTRDLPISNEAYFVVYQRCCRTEQIINIANPGNYGATYQVEITPQAQQLQNSSPVFLNYPATFICSNFPLDFNHSATDIDGDSLVYSFCNPLDGGGQNGNGNCNSTIPDPPCGPPFDLVNFIGAYSAGIPMGGNPIIGIDSETGILNGTPVIIGQFVVGVCVQEYRNGVYLGSILRDFQFNVVDCTPTIAAKVQADQIIGPKRYSIKRCGEKVITILNLSPQTPDLTSWRWELDLPNGQIFTTNTWHLTAVLPDFGTYQARLYLNPNPTSPDCRDTAYIDLYAYPGVSADFGFSWDICKETPVTFSDSSYSGANGGIVKRVWTFSTGDSAFVANPIYQFPAYGPYPVRLWLTDADGCKDDVLQLIDWTPQLPPEIPELAPQTVCLPNIPEFNLLSSLDLENFDVIWDFGDGDKDTIALPTHIYTQPGIYTVSVAIITPFDCFVSDTFAEAVRVFPSPSANFDYAPKTITNLENEVIFKNLSDSTVVLWNWVIGSNGKSSQANPTYYFLQDTGLTAVQLTVFNQYGCPDSTTKILDIVPKIRIYIPNAFAPFIDNGNGNDQFGVSGILNGYSDYRMTIWSRWGEMLFESTDPAVQWDGRSGGKGRVLPSGVYVYILRMKGPRGEPIQLEGTVTLVN
jgi:gliding motility-associated-like protein